MSRPWIGALVGAACTFSISGTAVAATVTLHVTGWTGPRDQAIIAAFEADNPDIHIEYENLSGTAPLLTRLLGGSGPDVAVMSWAYSGDFTRSGLLLDLSPLIARDKVDMADFFPPTLLPGQYQGRQYALPAAVGAQALYVNPDLWSTAGVPLPSDDWTWDDLANIAQKLMRTGPDGQTTQWAVGNPSSYAFWPSAVFSYGGHVFKSDFSAPDFDTAQSREALTSLQRLTHQMHAAAVPDVPFQSGTSAMAVWPTESIRVAGKFAASFVPKIQLSPLGPSGRAIMGGAHQIGITAQTPNKEAAWRFVRFYTSRQGQEISAGFGSLPVRGSAMQAAIQLNPDALVIAKEIDSWRQWANSQWSPLLKITGDAIGKLYAGQLSPEETALQVQQQITALWDRTESGDAKG